MTENNKVQDSILSQVSTQSDIALKKGSLYILMTENKVQDSQTKKTKKTKKIKTFRKNSRLIKAINIFDYGKYQTDISISNFGGFRDIKMRYFKEENYFYLIEFFKENGKTKPGCKTGKYKGIKYLYQIIEHYCNLINIDINSTRLELSSDYLRKLSREDFDKSKENYYKTGKYLFNYQYLLGDYERENDYNFETQSYGIIDYYHKLGFVNKKSLNGLHENGLICQGSRGEAITRFFLECDLNILMNNIRKIHKLEPINF